ncbi:choice-of-anchor L domain-containing protein [Flavobacterium sp.]|uniref:choice-of-anchor L domain-containing protein n=1 Tax=Flavobacterium sp. TaxID=239 RepID=UPI003D6BC803
MKIFLFLFLFFTGSLLQAQLIVGATKTPIQLVEDILVGSGVSPVNIKFNGSFSSAGIIKDQIAEFSTNFNQTNLGLSNGILLTTGKADLALGPNNSSSKSILPAVSYQGDADLALLTTQQIANVAVLEFDFVATGTTLNFQYVFASEEYPEYVNNSAYSDVFGFFISGPGITGVFSGNAKNIAAVPNTIIPISINTVNNGINNSGICTNCPYYYNNTSIGVNPTTWNPSYTTQYDGFTTPITAEATLVIGQTYHVKFAVANVSDNSYDSGVFIRNFNTNTLGLAENELASGFVVYPNPSNSFVTVSNASKAVITEINILDSNGRKVESQKRETVSDVTLNISKLNSGVYFLEIISAEGKTVKKVIKQ